MLYCLCSSVVGFLSIPFPSSIVHVNTQPSSASAASAHQIAPIILCFNPIPSPQPPMTGPIVRAALEILCAMPCSVPRTARSETELLTRMMLAGRANVLEITCKPTTIVKAGQTSHGLVGMSTRNGMSMYATGEKGRNVRYDFNVPRYDCTLGYTNICKGRPMSPITAVARPTRSLDSPRPPLKCKPCLLLGGMRGVGKKTKIMLLNALVWNASRKCVRSVRRTFFLRSSRKLRFLG